MQIPDFRRFSGVPIFDPGPLPDLRPRVLVCGEERILDDLRMWVESADRVPGSVFWSSDARVVPHIVLICGAIRPARERLVEHVAEWRSRGASVIWCAPVEAAERELQTVSAMTATIMSPRPSGARRSETGDIGRMASAARGLLHPLLSTGGIGVDATDIFGVLTVSPSGIVYHFDASDGVAAVKAAHPFAEERLARAGCALLATTYSQDSGWLNDCCHRMEACRATLAPNANIVATLNFKCGDSPADAAVYVPA